MSRRGTDTMVSRTRGNVEGLTNDKQVILTLLDVVPVPACPCNLEARKFLARS